MIFELLKGKSNFLKLSLPHCGGITGGILRIIAKQCPQMRHVDISYCLDVKSSDVTVLLDGCASLYHLNLKNCKSVTSDILTSIKSHRMRYLNLLGCNHFKESIAEFVKMANFSSTCQVLY